MALECLCQLTRVEEPALVRHRPSVLRGLMSSLADHKRVVRQAAARASTAWLVFLLLDKSSYDPPILLKHCS